MEPIQDMVAEHGKIKLALSILDRMRLEAESGTWPPTEHFSLMLDFVTTFADHCHHGKEEDFYFPAMLKKAKLEDATLISRLTAEHKKGRKYIQAIKDDLEAYDSRNTEAKQRIISNLGKYTDLLNAHITEENDFLFPRSGLYLSDEEMSGIMESFRETEEKIGLIKLAELKKNLLDLRGIYFD